jgi:hypothetical protein
LTLSCSSSSSPRYQSANSSLTVQAMHKIYPPRYIGRVGQL